MKRLFPIALLLAISIAEASSSESAPRPNVILLLLDDAGWADVGSFGGRIPARAGIYSYLPQGHPMHLRGEETTVAELARDAGYRTGHFGKWHLSELENDDQPGPLDQGFEYSLGTSNNASPSHRDPVNFVRNGKPVGKVEGYSCQLEGRDDELRRDTPLYWFFYRLNPSVALRDGNWALVARTDDADRPKAHPLTREELITALPTRRRGDRSGGRAEWGRPAKHGAGRHRVVPGPRDGIFLPLAGVLIVVARERVAQEVIVRRLAIAVRNELRPGKFDVLMRLVEPVIFIDQVGRGHRPAGMFHRSEQAPKIVRVVVTFAGKIESDTTGVGRQRHQARQRRETAWHAAR